MSVWADRIRNEPRNGDAAKLVGAGWLNIVDGRLRSYFQMKILDLLGLQLAFFPDGTAMALGEINGLVLDADLLCEFNLLVDCRLMVLILDKP